MVSHGYFKTIAFQKKKKKHEVYGFALKELRHGLHILKISV